MRLVAILSSLLLMSVTASAQDILPKDSSYVNGVVSYHVPPRYRDSESHPLRILGYVTHPVGWLAREAFFRPFSYLMSSTPTTRAVFGFREPFDARTSICFRDVPIPDCRALAPLNSLATVPTGYGSSNEIVISDDQVYFPDVAFDFNKASLNDLGKGRVRQAALLLSSLPDLQVAIEGHTDFVGTDEYNQALGQRRAETVVQELVDLGVDASRLAVVSYGESSPVFTEEQDWARAVNRRARITSAQ